MVDCSLFLFFFKKKTAYEMSISDWSSDVFSSDLGVAGAPHERSFAAVNAVVARLDPPPEFILFPGDGVIGLTRDEAALRAQWRHWFEVEMAWLDRSRIPLFHTTRSEEHTSELQSLMRISYAGFCLTKKKLHNKH